MQISDKSDKSEPPSSLPQQQRQQHQRQRQGQLVPLAKRQRAREYITNDALGSGDSNGSGGGGGGGGGGGVGSGVCADADDYGAECAVKWRSLAEPGLGLEATMYQVFVAMMLHKRAREVVVRAAMQALRDLCATTGAGGQGSQEPQPQQQQQQQQQQQPLPQQQLTCAAIAAMPQSTLAETISSVHFNNVKARHLREASQQLLVRHGGRVPASHFSLLALPGIGEKMAGLLRHVHKAVAANMATAMATPTVAAMATEAAPRPAGPAEEHNNK